MEYILWTKAFQNVKICHNDLGTHTFHYKNKSFSTKAVGIMFGMVWVHI